MGLFYADTGGVRGRPGPRKSIVPTSASVKQNLELIWEKRCEVCPLDKCEKTLTNPKMKATGAKRPVLYILGEAPGETEDQRGEQFIGRSGQLLRDHLPDWLEKKTRWNNVVRCRPQNNRNPDRLEIEACRPWIEEDIEKSKPRIILLLGKVPISWALQHDGSVENWRGRAIPVQIGKHKCWAVASFHPAYILRVEGGKEVKLSGSNNKKVSGKEIKTLFIRDIQLMEKIAKDSQPFCDFFHQLNVSDKKGLYFFS